MAVPKKKISTSRRGQRRAHDALNRLNVVVNKTTGELQLPHQVSLDGYYKGKEVIKEKVKAEKTEEAAVENTETEAKTEATPETKAQESK